MKKQVGDKSISALAALLTFTLFASCILSVLLSGAGAYRRLSQRDKEDFQRSTCAQYVATKLHQVDDCVTVGSFGGQDALLISQELDGEEYLTRIYCFNGYLMELFSAADADFSPEDGERVLPLKDFSLSLEGELLTAKMTGEDDAVVELCISLRRGEVLS
jgi:hypothetical protein